MDTRYTIVQQMTPGSWRLRIFNAWIYLQEMNIDMILFLKTIMEQKKKREFQYFSILMIDHTSSLVIRQIG